MLQKNKLLGKEALSSFCQQLAMIVRAGFPVYYGIALLKEDSDDPQEQALLAQIYEPMEAGMTLSEALAATGCFPDHMLQMLHLGEETGRLEHVLTSLSTYYKREAELRDNIRHAVTYPLIMSVMMLAILTVIITKVIPIFADVYAELGGGLSGSAYMLMRISTFLDQYLLLLLLILAILAAAGFLFFKTAAGKKVVARRKLSQSIATSRFANCMYLALSSGLDIDHGFVLADQTVDNRCVQARIRRCRELLDEGRSFAEALLESGTFSKMYSSLILIGYKTSAIDEVMYEISQSYEAETDEQFNHLLSMLEPTLIIVLSAFIGLILLSFLLPLLGIMASIG